MNGLLEILTNKQWAISPKYLNSTVEIIRTNLRDHTPLGTFEKKRPRAVVINAETKELQAYQRTREGEEYGNYQVGEMRVPFVDILTIDGPITREGYGCSYGSKDHRDMMMRCADNPWCAGHLLVMDTPGGSVWCKNDYKQAIDYAHEKGQRVFAFIDGDCLSMGMWVASMCDEVYVMNEADEQGCVGVLASFFTLKNGAHNDYDASDYHELYDPESYDKNREIRDIANDDNDRLLIEELTKLGAEFRGVISTAFPDATEEMKHGKIFPAGEVMGILCDGVSTEDDCIRRLFDLADGRVEPLTRTDYINPQNITMGIFDKAREALNAAFDNAEKQAKQNGTADAAEQVANLNTRITELQGERDNAQAQVDTLTAERDNLNQQVSDLTAERDNLQNSLNEANNTIAERDKEITNLKGQLGSNYQPGNRLNGQSAGEEKKTGKKTADEQLQECRDKMGWTKK